MAKWKKKDVFHRLWKSPKMSHLKCFRHYRKIKQMYFHSNRNFELFHRKKIGRNRTKSEKSYIHAILPLFFVTISLLFLGTGSNVVKGDMASTLSFSTISRWCFHSFYSLSWPNLLFFFISSCQGPSSYTPPAALDRNSRKKLDLLWAARSLPWHRQFFSLRRLVKLTDVNNLPMRLLTV